MVTGMYEATSSHGLLLILLFCVFVVGLSGGFVLSRVVLPSLHPELNIGAMYIQLTDTSRLDPFSNGTSFRKIMASLYFPLAEDSHLSRFQRPLFGGHVTHTLPYMPPKTAELYGQLLIPYGFPATTFENLSSQCNLETTKPDTPHSSPLVVFSHGGGAARFVYTTMLEDLARQGAVVAAIDHPHDALIVEFPDGENTIGLNKTLSKEEVELLVSVRAEDSFLIDHLGCRALFQPRPMNVTSVAAFGHSLGGASVAEAMLHDTRIKGGIDLDGVLFGSMEKANTTLS